MTTINTNPQNFGVIDTHALHALNRNIADILNHCMLHAAPQSALIVHDSQCDLAMALTAAYRHCLPTATFIDFDAVTPEAVHGAFKPLVPADLVVLVQTTSFRLEAFRIRVELFKRGLKVIEHVHLGRLPGTQALDYITSLAYDPGYYRAVGKALKNKIDRAKFGIIDSGGEQLVFGSPFEDAKLNIGDYSGMRNVGGQFPIGEVFTEARELEAVNGRVRIFVFGDTNFRVNRPDKPITLVVEKGRVVEAICSTPEFDRVLANIRGEEGEVWLRELGFGMNRAFTKDKLVDDIGTYERMCGIHLSLGAKHGIYNKPNFKRKDTKYHVDVFAITEAVLLDDEVVYRDGAWVI